jgi:hypothetical protein
MTYTQVVNDALTAAVERIRKGGSLASIRSDIDPDTGVITISDEDTRRPILTITFDATTPTPTYVIEEARPA